MNNIQLANDELTLQSKSDFYRSKALSDNTQKSYANDRDHYKGWGGELPATPKMVCEYVTAYAETLKTSTLMRRVKALREWHVKNGKVDPTTSSQVAEVIKGIRREHAEPPKKARPLLISDAKTIYHVLKRYNSLHDCRNLAIVLIGLFFAMRCSEITNMCYEHLKFSDKGLELFFPRSKNDQLKRGATRAIPYDDGEICPIRCLKEWLERANIKEGYVFRKISKTSNVLEGKIHDLYINNIIKQVTESCLDSYDGFTGHSLRRGFVTNGVLNKTELLVLAHHGRWESVQTMMGYFGETNTFDNNPCTVLLNLLNRD